MGAASLEGVLRRDGAVTLAALAVLCVLAWIYLLDGAGLGMGAWDMTTFALFPHREPGPMGGAAWDAAEWALVVAMWWSMMVAMMVPAAAPAILLYGRVHGHAVGAMEVATGVPRRQSIATSVAPTHNPNRRAAPIVPSGWFAAGYGLAWLGFSLVAAALQYALERRGIVSAMAMGSQARWLSASVLVLAGLYQFSPLKHACLSHCRAPAEFLSRHWQPHARGAVRLGVLHGAYCVGCCWLLMALLFVGGVMNVAWIAALTLLVLVEKVARGGRWVGRAAGVVLVAWGVATLLV